MNGAFTKYLIIAGFSAIAFMSSCKKEFKDDAISPNKLTLATAAKPLNASGAPVPSLDWSNISFMPTPPGAAPIPVPWQTGLGGSKIDDDMLNDYDPNEGWQLVYNTFSTQATYNPLYFMLYNQYRGLLRVYFYIAPGSDYPSSNIVHLLALRGANASASPLLNFAAQNIIDLNAHSQTVSQLQPYKVSTTGSWYAAEFEMAYDPNTPTIPYSQLALDWQINPNSISNVSLNGLQTGDISGTISNTSSGTNFFSSAANGAIDAEVKVGSTAAASAIKFVSSAVSGAIFTAAGNAVGGLVKGFLSGILGGSSKTSTQKVNLKINTKIVTTGTATTESQLYDNSFSIPGTQNVSNAVPFYPNYGSPMGVFYITGYPQIVRTLQSTHTTSGGSVGYDVDQRYSINQNSFQIVYNPAVTAIADIQNVTEEVVMLDVPTSISGLIQIGGTPEQVADQLVYTGAVTGIEHFAPRPLAVQIGGLAVRISFDVVPKNGAAKCRIVKTFLATQG